MTKTVIIVDVATSEGKGIVQHLAKYMINAVVRTTLRQCVKADPVRDQSQVGQIGPRDKIVCTSVLCMKFARKKVVMTTQLRTWLIRSSHCFIIEKFACDLGVIKVCTKIIET